MCVGVREERVRMLCLVREGEKGEEERGQWGSMRGKLQRESGELVSGPRKCCVGLGVMKKSLESERRVTRLPQHPHYCVFKTIVKI